MKRRRVSTGIVFPFYQDVEKFADQQDEKAESSGDSTDSEVECHPLLEKFSKKGECIPLRGNTICTLLVSSADCNFLTIFCSSDPSFNSNILKSLYVRSELLRMRNYAISRL